MAVDDDGRLLGVVTWDQVRRALQQGTPERRRQIGAPSRPIARRRSHA